MRNKKGFTLPEVLAVIVIIGILAVLVTAGILGYFRQGKDDYNSNLSNQLLLTGKTYYSDHKNELPTATNTKAYSYVTLPEMQSNNYVTNEFKDSEGRECSPSFVYVKQKMYDSNEYEYIPCLICQDEDGTQYSYNTTNSVYCNLANWDDEIAPTCASLYGIDYATKLFDNEVKLNMVKTETGLRLQASSTDTTDLYNKISGEYIKLP